ncbi:MAG: aminoglycoside 6-adenylyltransferase [Gammaproteobacteria bacterium]
MKNRRSEQDMMKLILDIAQQDERIRGVILNGSRTSPSAKKDIFQDYDIIYIVKDVEPLVNDRQWIKPFGEILLMQKPDEIDGIWPGCKDRFAYLMELTDGNRVDLTLMNHAVFKKFPSDSQTLLLLDKDHILGTFPPPSDKDYLPKPPTQEEFYRCCNEFFWVAHTVGKGLWRKELTYVKYVGEHIAKEELIKLLIYYAGIKTDFKKCIGKHGKYLQDYLEPDIWERFVKTYVDADYTHMWNGLFEMCALFHDVALKVSAHYKFPYHEHEYKAVVMYLRKVLDII